MFIFNLDDDAEATEASRGLADLLKEEVALSSTATTTDGSEAPSEPSDPDTPPLFQFRSRPPTAECTGSGRRIIMVAVALKRWIALISLHPSLSFSLPTLFCVSL